MRVGALDRLGRSLTEVLKLPGWLRENRSDSRFTTSGASPRMDFSNGPFLAP